MTTKIRKSKTSVPPRWRKEVERILITDEQLARRSKILAREIERDFRGHEMVVVSLLSGTVMFLADLIRHLNLPLRLDFIGVSSYGLGTESGELVFTSLTKEAMPIIRYRTRDLSRLLPGTARSMRRMERIAGEGLVSWRARPERSGVGWSA